MIAAARSAALARTSVRDTSEEQIAIWRDQYVATWRKTDRRIIRR
jgi:hypothetical protein